MLTPQRKLQLTNYAILVALLGCGVFLFLLVWPDKYWLRVITVAGGLIYLGWGLTTHALADQFSPRIFWEYAGVALLGSLILWLLI